jgi:hypothetical protein
VSAPANSREHARRVGRRRHARDGGSDDGGSSDAGIPWATGTGYTAATASNAPTAAAAGTTSAHAAKNDAIRRTGKVEVIKNSVREEQTHQLLKLAERRRPYCELCRVPKHAVSKAGTKRHSG